MWREGDRKQTWREREGGEVMERKGLSQGKDTKEKKMTEKRKPERDGGNTAWGGEEEINIRREREGGEETEE